MPTDTLQVAAQYQSYIIIVVSFAMVILAMLAAAVVLVYNIFKRYQIIQIAAGGTDGNRRNAGVRGRRRRSV